MAREIKFRAWNKDQETWVVVFFVSQYGEFYQHFSIDDPEDVVIMQYTGLKDKNGTDIYEGDRIVVTDEHGNTDSGPVWYLPERLSYCIVWHDGESSYNLSDTKPSEIEVQGNIYESPGLLEEDKQKAPK